VLALLIIIPRLPFSSWSVIIITARLYISSSQNGFANKIQPTVTFGGASFFLVRFDRIRSMISQQIASQK
jgi:hypothetical protein